MTNASPPTQPEDVGRGRVEALSDGVFAIVITLLVLEIRVPHIEAPDSIGELARALMTLTPKFVSWVISFVTVCVIWLNHHRLLKLASRIDNGLFWLNVNLLLWTSFIPFPTALMGEYPANTLAVMFYGLVMLLMGLGFVFMRVRMLGHDDLLRDDVDRAVFRRGLKFTIVMGPVAYALGGALALVHVSLSFVCYAAIALYFVLPHALRTRR
jgi:TMEM175 potassium channel family protein